MKTETNSCSIGHVRNQTAFKICAYFEKKPNGVYYTKFEIEQKKNRKYIDSYDYITTSNAVNITRHDEAYKKQNDFFNRNVSNMLSAFHFAIINGKEFCIKKIIHKKMVAVVEPHFYIGKQPNSIVVIGLKGAPISLNKGGANG
jgi:hypothetical protein